MIDKISQFGSLNNGDEKPKKVEKKNRLKDIGKKKIQTGKENSPEVNKDSVAKVEISKAAREQLMLRAEAERYLKQVEQQEEISPEKVAELKQKVSENYYLKEKVIDKIVDKLLNLPGFQDTK